MIELDGNAGEGGGQILRTALGLSALTGVPFLMTRVRSNRPKPGLAAQHLAAVGCVARLCSAEVEGAELGSQEVTFRPGKITGGKHVVDVGTAGSVMLVLQAALLASVGADGPTELEVHGGTDVPLSPPASYYSLVLLPLLGSLGFPVSLDVRQRGFYPEGGGIVVAKASPGSLRPRDWTQRGIFQGVEGVAFARNLPDHVVDRMASECRRRLVDHQPISLAKDQGRGPSTGAGVVLVARFDNGTVGASCLGERGLSAEKVAALAVERLRLEMGHATLDIHSADQLLPYMALASGPSSFLVSEVSDHLRTQMGTVKRFVPVRFGEHGDGPFLVTVQPIRT